MTPYLTDDEIAHITEPLKQGAARCKFIRAHYGVTVKERPNGQPLVWRVDFEAAGGQIGHRRRAPAKDEGKVIRPDWRAVRAKRAKSPGMVG